MLYNIMHERINFSVRKYNMFWVNRISLEQAYNGVLLTLTLR